MPLGLLVITRAVTRRAQRGLYAGKKVLFGNNISEDGGNKTRRNWKPNAQQMTLYSEILDRRIRMRVTNAALRNIDKAGGLDNYILKTKEKDLDSEFGLALKQQMVAKLVQHRQQGFAAAAIQNIPDSSS